ncbi:penicillin-binding transpeptidase domain-containing protein [Solihabitans fulvus]|uniref:penicillin-binding transpeptidase domain-containing protein n=1 Tax=Solihabitans fulvus TaxID=1892852 RepID=UPI001CB76782|nr:penicillin-binding transpeptidase domain-containing protein [Solihabitans fulvus]
MRQQVDRRRLLPGALLALLLVLPVAGCGLFQSKPSAEDVTKDFLGKLASGDTQATAGLTDDANSAKALLDSVRGALKPAGMTTTVDQVRDASGDSKSAEASVTLNWDLGHKRIWTYQSKVELRKDSDDWKVHWAPTVVHPKLAAQQTIALRETPADLAPVLDRDGAPLLSPEKVISVTVDPKTAGDLTAASTALAAALVRFDNTITPQSITDAIAKAPTAPYTVVSLRDSDYQQVKAAIYDLPGVSFPTQTRLLAPDKNFGSQILPAIRKSVDDQIAGLAGWRVVSVNATGGEVNTLFTKAPEPAQAVHTTLGKGIQIAAQEAVGPVPQAAVLVAMQPSTGEVLAVAQNAPADAQGPIALSGNFPPGSTFKIVTAAAGMASGTAPADSPQPCPGKTVIDGKRVVPNDHEFDKGTIPLHSAFAFSCNTTFAQVAAALPADALTTTARQLGLGVDFELPAITTVTGSVPPATDIVERAEDGFGQGKVVASPFGMALVASSVAKGSMPTPTLLRGVQTKVKDAPSQPLAPEVLTPLRDMMREVVTSGTAGQLKDIADVRGKTGTAQFGDGVNSHGWFVGYRGDLAFAVLILGANSSVPAVDVTGKFLRALG